MIEFTVTKSFNCDPDIIWNIVKDLNSVPNYWKGTRELKVKEIEKGIYEGTVRFAFPSTGKIKIVINEQKRTVTFQYLSGTIKGYNFVKVSRDSLSSRWEVSTLILLKLFEKRISEHFKIGTEHALERIVTECQTLKERQKS